MRRVDLALLAVVASSLCLVLASPSPATASSREAEGSATIRFPGHHSEHVGLECGKVGNEGKHTRKVTIKVKVYSKEKQLLAEDSRTDTISGDTEKDQISVWTEIVTRDYPKADFAHVSAKCERED
jgi:hypothetical protein